jgi:hypothetical protein
VRGIHRYLVVTIHVDGPNRRAVFERLVRRHFRRSPEQWRALPLIPVPHCRYQPAVAARLIELPPDYVPAPRRPARQRRKKR